FGTDDTRAPLAADETWLIARVLQTDIARIEADAPARFAPDAFPGEHLAGRVDSPPAYVDPDTHTAPVRVRVRDPEGRLRPGMTGAVAIDAGRPRTALVVPAAAVVYDDARPLVFVVIDGRYEARPVRLGVVRDGRAEVVAGLSAGTTLVVTGAASLLSADRLPPGDEAG
ncbi:MAG TPA: efflux RND transporter periplasmic adaptor subunit, partial [Candidatus Binatia bacterium]|nr:efflux RND transporter periplasmic adaptor subunit [Candidatus Binatia bacterium]